MTCRMFFFNNTFNGPQNINPQTSLKMFKRFDPTGYLAASLLPMFTFLKVDRRKETRDPREDNMLKLILKTGI
jgi:hypothetical protein